MQLTFNETTDLGEDKNTVRIQDDGTVMLN
jgi:hypothetical protein